ncbi:hypothetical protein [Aquimarina algiphila]|uniref:hypothetical protein n=1 Tax=Aquimarina algiphila TaxID=2047982 RepID=UPI002331045E|nr:hypothetical protein [Aquimarina algiphila]
MKQLISTAITLITIITYGQKNDKVDLKWKLDENETLIYKIIESKIDTSTTGSKVDDLINVLKNDEVTQVKKTQLLLQEVSDSMQKIIKRTELTHVSPNVIDIVISQKKKTRSISIQENKENVNRQILVRGSVYEDGSIHSFWLDNFLKNKIALFFELPTKSVGVGDTWKIDVNTMNIHRRFKCDSAYKTNKVRLVDLKKTNKDTIAIIKYEIEEYFKGSNTYNSSTKEEKIMKFGYYATAEFSIHNGRWISYNAIMEAEERNRRENMKFVLTYRLIKE